MNETSAIPGNENHHIIMLDVFHQLHCLVSSTLSPWMPCTRANLVTQNILRKGLSPDYYHDEKMDYEHYMHCIDSIRQSLMCSVDITPIVFKWHEELGMLWHDENVLHTCRDFDGVMKWALENKLADGLDWMKFPHVI